MTDRNRNVLIGLFVLVGLGCLAVLIVLFGESRGIFSQRYVVRAKFDRIAGVREGTDVNLAGVWAGNVTKVELIDPGEPGKGVYAVMQIDQQYVVPRGAVASVVTPIMGQAAINIIPPTAAAAPLPIYHRKAQVLLNRPDISPGFAIAHSQLIRRLLY